MYTHYQKTFRFDGAGLWLWHCLICNAYGIDGLDYEFSPPDRRDPKVQAWLDKLFVERGPT